MDSRARWHRLERKLIAILRGIEPAETRDIVLALADRGFEAVEIPLNSPDPLRSIEIAAKAIGDRCLVGAGTVLSAKEVQGVADAGGTLFVSPNVDPPVIARAAELGMISFPGVFTATEALAALSAGATGLKFFPASILGPSGIAAIRAVLPRDIPIAAVGGVGEKDFAAYAAQNIAAFGLGSSLYRPGATAAEVAERARATIAAHDAVFPSAVSRGALS